MPAGNDKGFQKNFKVGGGIQSIQHRFALILLPGDHADPRGAFACFSFFFLIVPLCSEQCHIIVLYLALICAL